MVGVSEVTSVYRPLHRSPGSRLVRLGGRILLSDRVSNSRSEQNFTWDIFQPGYQHPGHKLPDHNNQAFVSPSYDMLIFTLNL